MDKVKGSPKMAKAYKAAAKMNMKIMEKERAQSIINVVVEQKKRSSKRKNSE